MMEKAKRAMALGFFDGLHLAHMKVLNEAVRQKINGLVPSVLIFDEHPITVLTGKTVDRLITTAKRNEILQKMDMEICNISFREICNYSAQRFVKEILIDKFNVAYLCCGYNYKFGKNGEGDVEVLSSLCQKYGIQLSVIEQVVINGEAVSSTAIRKAAANGDIATANKMLGRPLEFCTGVFHGDERGRLLGAPTANQYLPENFVVPKFGVYASTVQIKEKEYPAVTNIGIRPTFNGSSLRSETYIIGFEGNLYGQFVNVKLYSFLREEMKFSSFDELKTQINTDCKNALIAIAAMTNNTINEKICTSNAGESVFQTAKH